MTHVLTPALQESLRFSANYRMHRDYLMALDRVRFRALGDDNTRAFVREGMVLADRLKLGYVEEAQYLLFVMSFLGTYFTIDPRYADLKMALRAPEVGQSPVQGLHRAFAAFAGEFIGRDQSLYGRALADFARRAGAAMQSADPVAACVDAICRAYGFVPDLPARLPVLAMVDNARITAAGLGMAAPQGVALCLGLGFWLGSAFDRDPLYPWVRAKVEGAGPSERLRLAALEGYAAKRLGRQLLHFKDRPDVRL